jgi:hypothetical protein
MSRILSSDPIRGKKTTMHFQGDDYIVESQEDVTDLVERNKARLALQDERTPWGELAQVAEIPPTVYWDLMRKGIAQDEVAFRRWLDDPENRFFRTRHGRLSK